jgi:hypothetical protein
MGKEASDWKNTKLNFKIFEDRQDFIDKGYEAIQYLADNIDTTSDRGVVSNFSKEDAEKLVIEDELADMVNEKKYEKPDLLKNAIEKFDEIKAKIDMGGVFKKQRLIITDDKRGIFDFGIASKGLYNSVEYFSLQLAQDLPEEFADNIYGNKPSGIVNVNFVKEEYVFNEKQFWYTSFTNGQKYLLTKQNEGTRAIELKLPGAKEVFKTSVKKSYVMFEKKGGKAKMVELYIPIHRNIELKHILPLLMAAKFFQEYGVKTRITALRIYHETKGGNEFLVWGYPIKDYGDEIDFNFLSLNGVDRRWWNSVRVVVTAMSMKTKVEEIKQRYPNKKIDENADNIVWNGGGDAPENRKSYVALFSRYRNWYMNEIKEGRVKPLRTDKKLVISAYESDINSIYDEKSITREFFKILDTVDFQFNKAEDACKRIYKRMVTDELSKIYTDLKTQGKTPSEITSQMSNNQIRLTAQFKDYVINILIDTYTFPTGGQYAEEKESAEELTKELDKKLDDLTKYLQTV